MLSRDKRHTSVIIELIRQGMSMWIDDQPVKNAFALDSNAPSRSLFVSVRIAEQ